MTNVTNVPSKAMQYGCTQVVRRAHARTFGTHTNVPSNNNVSAHYFIHIFVYSDKAGRQTASPRRRWGLVENREVRENCESWNRRPAAN